jgi:uncharacterized protein (TIGR02145 family)
MKKLLLLSALFIFACSSDDSSDDYENKLLNSNGEIVPTIVYGTQEWSVENADYTSYSDGTPIPQVTDDSEWISLTTGAWCYYDNDPNKGKLYNWYAVVGIHDDDPNTPNKEFAPEGWHVPSDSEWSILAEYMIANGYNYDGSSYSCSPCPQVNNKIAESLASNSGWNPSINEGTPGYDQSANNSSGFNALPVGYRDPYLGWFMLEGDNAIFMTSSEDLNDYARDRTLINSYPFLVESGCSKTDGYSVRLVRN